MVVQRQFTPGPAEQERDGRDLGGEIVLDVSGENNGIKRLGAWGRFHNKNEWVQQA